MQNKLILDARASTILFNFLVEFKSRNKSGVFLIPANVCPIVPVIFLKSGVLFEFIDISLDNYCIQKTNLLERVNENNKVKGILYVRSYGFMEDLSSYFDKVRKQRRDIVIIDDRCLCIPTFDNKKIYKNVDLTLFSTGYAKYVELNGGGFAFLETQWSYNKHIEKFKESDHQNLVSQMNETIDNDSRFKYEDSDWLIFNKPIKLEKYKKTINDKIKEIIRHKLKINKIYSKSLPQELQLKSKFNNWRFNILVKDKKMILKKIFENDLFASSHYASISHLFGGAFSSNASKVNEEIINLFNDYRFSEEMAHKVTKIIKNNIS